MSNDALELPAVRQKFEESIAALTGIQALLEQLEVHAEDANRSSSALQDAGQAVSLLAGNLAAAITEIQLALDAAQAFLKGANLAALETSVAETTASVDRLTEALEGSLAAAEARAARAEAEVATLRALLPPRLMKRLDGSKAPN